MNTRITLLLLIASGLLVVHGTASATGALFGRQINSTATYQSMEIRTYDAQVSINDHYAVTKIDQRCFNNLRATVEVTFIFPLPENAFVTYFAYWFNGQKYVASIKERQQAQKTYDSLVKRMIDPALLVDLGNNIFKLNVAPVHANSELRFEMTYVELIPQNSGFSDFRFILKTTGLSPTPLQRVSVVVDATSQRPFESFVVPGQGNTPATTIDRVDSTHYRAIFGDENYVPDSDLLIRYRVAHKPFDATVISFLPKTGDSLGPDGYYGMWVTLPDTLEGVQRTGRSIVFTADVSSSMYGERMDGLKQALGIFLDGLIPEDRFNILVFSTGVATFRPDLVQASESEIEAARMYVQQLGASGLTNIDEALLKSLSMSFSDTSANNLLIFMTDGVPTWGETLTGAIIDSAVARNGARVRILPFGIGNDLSPDLLDELAARNGGYATYIPTGAGFAESIRAFFQRVVLPPITDINVSIVGLSAYDRVPEIPTTTEAGRQVVQFGRYITGGEYPIRGSAMANGVQLSLETTGYFQDTAGGPREIGTLWARGKIDDLLRQINIYGEKKELVDAVILLSIRFGILTPYTALYADPNGTGDVDERVVALRLAVESVAPNPMRDRTVVKWHMPQGGGRHASVDVLDDRGQVVAHLVNADVESGPQQTVWTGIDDEGNSVPTGIYFIRVVAGGQERTVKVVIIR